MVNPQGDKVSRALAVQPMFATGYIYAPVKDWSDLVVNEMALFPKGRYDDATDSVTMCLSWLRSSGVLQTDAEATAAEVHTVMHKPRLKALYPCAVAGLLLGGSSLLAAISTGGLPGV